MQGPQGNVPIRKHISAPLITNASFFSENKLVYQHGQPSNLYFTYQVNIYPTFNVHLSHSPVPMSESEKQN